MHKKHFYSKLFSRFKVIGLYIFIGLYMINPENNKKHWTTGATTCP